MTNLDCIIVRWVSHYLVCLALNRWRHPLRSLFPTPIPSTHPALCLLFLRHREADSRLMAGWPTGHVADTVLPPHGSTVRNLHLQAWWLKLSVAVTLSMCLCVNGCSCSPLFSHTQAHFTAPLITFDFFGEFDPVWVCERARLLIYVVYV